MILPDAWTYDSVLTLSSVAGRYEIRMNTRRLVEARVTAVSKVDRSADGTIGSCELLLSPLSILTRPGTLRTWIWSENWVKGFSELSSTRNPGMTNICLTFDSGTLAKGLGPYYIVPKDNSRLWISILRYHCSMTMHC